MNLTFNHLSVNIISNRSRSHGSRSHPLVSQTLCITERAAIGLYFENNKHDQNCKKSLQVLQVCEGRFNQTMAKIVVNKQCEYIMLYTNTEE